MLKILRERLRQGHRTTSWPQGPAPALPEHFRGAPLIDSARCPEACRICADACPADSIRFSPKAQVDLGRCIFCSDCVDACPARAITHGKDFSLAASSREELVTDGRVIAKARALDETSRRIFGRSLKLRQVSAGGCNACEADINVLGTVGWDLGRFGIQFVASPRHADGMLITGAISTHMDLAVKKTWEAIPAPKLVIAVGACAISGGLFRGNPEVKDGVSSIVPIDLFIPGCPPHPLTILDGLVRLLGKIPEKS